MRKFYAVIAFICLFKLGFGQTTITINTGASVTADQHSGPIYRSSAASAYDYSQFAYLYSATDLASLGSGATISKLAWNKTNTNSTVGAAKFKIYMKNSTATAYTTATAFSTLISGATLVYDNSALNIPATAGFLDFVLTTPFVYAGNSVEIMVDWDISAVSGNPTTGVFTWEKTTVANSILGYCNSTTITSNLDPSSNSIGSLANTRPTIQVTYTPGAACAGTPTAGTTVSSATDVCTTTTINLSVIGASSGVSGLSYLWQSSSNNTSWTDIPTATSATYSTTQSVATYYRRKITCGASSTYSTSVNVTMTTPATVPYTEDFNGITPPDIPNCIKVENVNADATTWGTFAGNGTSIPTNAIRYTYNSAAAADDWFYTRGITLTAGTTYRLQFNYKASDGPTYTEKLEVKYGTGQAVGSMTSSAIFTDNNIATAVASPYTGADVTFTVPATGVYYLGFHCYSALDQGYLYVDDVAVTVAPSCIKPTAVNITSITASSATVNWTASATATSGYQVAVQTSSTAPASGTPATGVSYNANSLTAATLYYVFVRSNCGSGSFSEWTVATTFTTACGTASTPYNQNFDAVTAPALPVCISVLDVNNDTYTWATTTNSTYLIGGTNSIVYLYNTSGAADDWFFTAPINMTAGTSYSIKFTAKAASTTFPEKLEVKYGLNPTVAGMTSTALYSNTNLLGTVRPQIALTSSTSGAYYFGFHAFSSANEYYLAVDSIVVDLTSNLPVTISQFKGEKNGSVNDLSWTTASEINNAGFELQRSADGINFSLLSFVGSKAANGTSNASISYSLTDTRPFTSTSYYRLKQIDKDGKSTLSNIVLIKGTKPTKLELASVYPNPVTDKLNVVVASPKADRVTFVVMDLAGKVIMSQLVSINNGDNNVQLNVSALGKGTYTIKAICADGCETAISKFIK